MKRRRVRVWDFSHPNSGFFLAAAVALFVFGLLTGFLLSGHILLPQDASLQISSDGVVSPLRFVQVFWSDFRWSFLAFLLAMSALGLFLLYPLVFIRGLLIGFSFTQLFVSGSRGPVFVRFICAVVLTCAPLLLLAACGVKRALNEIHRENREDSLFDLPAFPFFLFLAALLLALVCSCAELWLLPGFASYIQPFT